MARLIPAPAHQNLRVGDHGTCVTVNDLFGNMPVRVKSRALAFQKPDELEREWEHLRYLLASLMLANPQLSKLNITDVEKGKRVTIRARSQQYQTDGMDLGRIGLILTQSGLVTSPAIDTWHVLSASVPDLTVRAAISTTPSPSKKLQFVSLGNAPVLSRNGTNVLFSEVNRLIALSDFGNTATPSRSASLSRPTSMRGRTETGMSGRSSTKSVNKWPMFYIRIDTSSAGALSEDADEITPDSERSLQRILDVLEVMILEFLKQQNLRPRASRRQSKYSDRGDENKPYGQRAIGRCPTPRQEGPGTGVEGNFGPGVKLPTFRRSQAVNSGQNFNSWSRVKSAKDSLIATTSADGPGHLGVGGGDLSRRPAQSSSRNTGTSIARQFDSDRDIASHVHTTKSASSVTPFQHRTTENTGDTRLSATQDSDQHLSWTDPQTGKSHLINARTGQTIDRKASALGPRLRSGSLFAAPPSDHPRVDESPGAGLWVDNLLEAWENPTFKRTEMPVLNLDPTESYIPNAVGDSHNCLQHIGSLGGAQVAKFRGKLRRHILADATIISQVDQKFILAKMDTTSPGDDRGNGEKILVLVDQHAADERCRVEQLFDDMFISLDESPEGITVRTIDVTPITLDVSVSEHALFRKYMGFFRNWGIFYEIETPASGSIVSVTKLPALIAERCRLEPNLLLDLLRREIWTREDDGRGPFESRTSLNPSAPNTIPLSGDEDPTVAEDTTTSHPWVIKMSGCPQGIIDLLNSRACRTSIMFNDPLSIQECKTLVTRLARCAFPFQCAHGRPSMVPILDLRPELGQDHSVSSASLIPHDCYGNDDSKFSDAFRLRYGN